MTQNQNNYWKMMEEKRHNLETEYLTDRLNATTEKSNESSAAYNYARLPLVSAQVRETNANTSWLTSRTIGQNLENKLANETYDYKLNSSLWSALGSVEDTLLTQAKMRIANYQADHPFLSQLAGGLGSILGGTGSFVTSAAKLIK